MSMSIHQMLITSDHDVIMMRQEVRQLGRQVGLGLIEQARITTAISTVARQLLALESTPVFAAAALTDSAHTGVEVVCHPRLPALDGVAALAEQVHFADARLLVDEAEIIAGPGGVRLVLRIWLRVSRGATL